MQAIVETGLKPSRAAVREVQQERCRRRCNNSASRLGIFTPPQPDRTPTPNPF
jgi:hypothetical protein